MKAANVLITKNGVLKLADFGLARAFSACKNGQTNRYTNRVVTLWYRPPGEFRNPVFRPIFLEHSNQFNFSFYVELLLGDRNYGPPVDMWGAGCIMAEMWTRSPIMQGRNEQQQIILISQLCGSFTPEVNYIHQTFRSTNSLNLIYFCLGLARCPGARILFQN